MDNVSLGQVMTLAAAHHFPAAPLVFFTALVVVAVLAVLRIRQIIRRTVARKAETRRRHNREMAQLYAEYSEQAAFWTPIIIPDANKSERLPQVPTGN